jgi:hypothetical protein
VNSRAGGRRWRREKVKRSDIFEEKLLEFKLERDGM